MLNRWWAMANAVACAGFVASSSSTIHETQNVQIPVVKPVRMEMVAAQPSARFSGVAAALEIQTRQPNIPAGLRAVVVVTNKGKSAVEVTDDDVVLEIQTTAGQALQPAGTRPATAGGKSSEAVRLAPNESRRIEVAVTEVARTVETPLGPVPNPSANPNAPPGANAPNLMPLMGGAYRVRARVRLSSADGKRGDAAVTASFESAWVTVILGSE